jgi:hypothetical protein
LLQLGGQLQPLEPICPETVHELPQSGETLGPGPVEPARPLSPFAQQAGSAQHRQVLGDRGPRDIEVGGNLAGAQLLVADQGQDLATPRLGDRTGDPVNGFGGCEVRVHGL